MKTTWIKYEHEIHSWCIWNALSLPRASSIFQNDACFDKMGGKIEGDRILTGLKEGWREGGAPSVLLSVFSESLSLFSPFIALSFWMSSFSDCCLTSGQHLCWIKKVEEKGVKRWKNGGSGVELSQRGRGKRNLNFCFLFSVGNYDWDGAKGRDGWKRAFSSEHIDEEHFVAGEVKILWNPTILLELILERATSACFLHVMKLRGSHRAIIFWPWMSFKWAKPS